ncbi:hypothetical protein TNCT_232861 [Trichonephila clavata]|uniref:Uncharacterized protein n=1 Tax=Trichonephila clavata TaxID=2740835 RepID=A0A8X6IX50_TRICU|nr:hypothetical protein TNCT_232861 [Trichonephila clavata]
MKHGKIVNGNFFVDERMKRAVSVGRGGIRQREPTGSTPLSGPPNALRSLEEIGGAATSNGKRNVFDGPASEEKGGCRVICPRVSDSKYKLYTKIYERLYALSK